MSAAYSAKVISSLRYLLVLITACCGITLLSAPAGAQTQPQIANEDDLPIALLVDITNSQVLYARNAERRFVPASITKVMTMYRAFELIEDGSLDPNQSLTMTNAIWRDWAGEGSTMWLNAGEEVRVADALIGIANVSANDAAILLAETQAGSVQSWVDGMNERARSLGMTATHFGTPNGWPDEGRTFTTANDLVVLARALITNYPESYRRFIGKPGLTYNSIAQTNYDPLIGRLEGADGIKTGYTNEAGFGYLGTAERDGQRLVLVVAGANRTRIRAQAARELMEWGFGAHDRPNLYSKGEIVGFARVQMGGSLQVPLQTDRDVFMNVPRGRSPDMELSIEYDGPLRAPIIEGSTVATLVVKAPGMEAARVPLRAAQSIETAGFFDRIRNAIVGWFT